MNTPFVGSGNCQHCGAVIPSHFDYCPARYTANWGTFNGAPGLGWMCPRCGVVHAPTTPRCWCAPNLIKHEDAA